MLIPFLIIWLCGVFMVDFPIIIPNLRGLVGGFYHYVIPLILAILFQLGMLTTSKFRNKISLGLSLSEVMRSFHYIPFLTVVFYLHFSFKAWMPLANTKSYDLLYNEIDQAIPITTWLTNLGQILDFNGICFILYALLFISMFMLSFICHSTFDNFTNLRRVVTGTAAILLIGGIGYWIAPAVGPFIFQRSPLESFYYGQEGMYSLYLEFINTNTMPLNYFGNSPAAMPSLHVANSLFFLLSAKRSLPKLAMLYTPIFIFIVIVAVASKWHYTIDLVFGTLLALIVYFIMDRVFEDNQVTNTTNSYS